jgi:hypothetical protein
MNGVGSDNRLDNLAWESPRANFGLRLPLSLLFDKTMKPDAKVLYALIAAVPGHDRATSRSPRLCASHASGPRECCATSTLEGGSRRSTEGARPGRVAIATDGAVLGLLP